MKRVLMVLCMLTTSQVFAIPQLISYQGALTDPSGAPLDTTVSITFTIYDNPTAGAALWTESHSSVAVANGQFRVVLGSVTTLNDLFTANRFLGITVGGDSEMIPREQIVSVAHAYRVGTVDGASGGTISGELTAGSANNNQGFRSYVLGDSNGIFADFVTVSGGRGNSSDADYSFVGGGYQNSVNNNYGVVGGGQNNHTDGTHNFIGGGVNNQTTGLHATIAGGSGNQATLAGASVGGGDGNQATGTNAAISGGLLNVVTGSYATIAGGAHNRARGDYSVIGGGGGAGVSDSNFVGDNGATVAGGIGNHAVMEHSTVGGGLRNRAADLGATVGGGLSNVAGNAATVAGGDSNTAAGIVAFVGGGRFNVASDFGGTVSGGYDNQATASYSTIAGGSDNRASAGNTVVGGGDSNLADGIHSTVSGGRYGRARGSYSSIIGGGGASEADSNSARGEASAILGGRRNETTGRFSLAGGYRAKALHDGAFVWADSTGANFSSTAADQFNVRSSGGINMWTNSTATVGVTLLASDNTWNSICDSTLKTKIERVSGRAMLDKIVELPVYRWHHKDGDPNLQHIGPMAQDFWTQFHVGGDSLKISTIDPSGIALAAIQELAKENEQLQAQVSELRAMVQTMQAEMKQTNVK